MFRFFVSSASVGRTGAFIALTNLTERIKTEAVVEVYQTVKKMRQQRTAMVQMLKKMYISIILSTIQD